MIFDKVKHWLPEIMLGGVILFGFWVTTKPSDVLDSITQQLDGLRSQIVKLETQMQVTEDVIQLKKEMISIEEKVLRLEIDNENKQ